MAAVLLLAILLAGIRMPQNVKAAGNLPGKLFSKPSTEYNNNLAYLSAEFCDNAQGESSTKIESILNEYGIKNKVYNYGESAAFVIGHKEVNIEGEGKANVLVIIARGTETWAEKIGDWQKDNKVVKLWEKGKSAVKKGFVYAVAVKMRLCYPDVKLSNEFKIEGKWKNVGAATFGQVQSGAIVIFNGGNCAIYSPYDTYAFYKEDDQLYLDCTSFLFRDTVQFKVKILDNDNIELNYGSTTLRLKRVN